METIFSKARKQGAQRRTARNTGTTQERVEWPTVAGVAVGVEHGEIRIVKRPEGTRYQGKEQDPAIFLKVTSQRRSASVRLDTELFGALMEILIDQGAAAQVLEEIQKCERLSQVPANSQAVVAAPVVAATAPVVGGIDTDDIWSEPVVRPRINRWKGNDSLEGMRQHLQVLQPQIPYAKIERLTPDRSAAREIQRKLEERGAYAGFEVI